MWQEKSLNVLVWDFGTCCQSGAFQSLVTRWQESRVKDRPVHRNNDRRISQCPNKKTQPCHRSWLRGGAVCSSLRESSVMSWTSLKRFIIDFWCWLWKGIHAPQRAQSEAVAVWKWMLAENTGQQVFLESGRKIKLKTEVTWPIVALNTPSVVLTGLC